MRKEDNDKKPVILPYKDANLNFIIEPDDYLKFLKDPSSKEKADECLNEIRQLN